MKLNLVFLCCVVEIFGLTRKIDSQDKSEDVLSRTKRFLVFVPNGGVLKFVSGYLGPIDIPSWQNINCMRNVQFQYDLPRNWSAHPTSLPGLSRSEGRGFSGSTEIKLRPDKSREIAYDLVETMLNREGKDGRECLLRTICEVAETPVHHNGLVGELIQIFFTPGEHENIHEDFRYAREAGLNKINCEKMYSNCPFGHGILDSVSLIKEFKFQDWLNF